MAGQSSSAAEFFETVMSATESALQSWLARLRGKARRRDPICGRRLFDFGDLRRLAHHPLVTIASHSMSHQVLSALPEAWCRWEMKLLRGTSGDNDEAILNCSLSPIPATQGFSERLSKLNLTGVTLYAVCNDGDPTVRRIGPFCDRKGFDVRGNRL